ncbi:hypothetical protein V1389_16215 [Flavobacterium rakeshii]|uniref:hypothetical protein n=1 Tax=Flavobacterium rakeshii TaxID=1038845 RepID=UPI002E7ABA09|nr:hypothetical protein [Flavobacterium rakeshii]MEE1899894.1 hypothetical protein [Flavobacterium rakeshii]
MKTIIFYLTALLCLAASKMGAQTFERRARDISYSIAQISKEEKDSLKIEVEEVNKLLETDDITKEEANKRKLAFAEKRAANIEERVAVEREKLDKLVQDRIDGNIEESFRSFSITYDPGTVKFKKDTTVTKKYYEFKRTTSQFVFALGFNRLMTDGKVDNDNYKLRSDFYEWGLTFNTRILRNNNLLHAKYGLSLQYNNLRPEDDKVFVTDEGKTILADSGTDIDLARLRYVNLVVPVHLEFDFTKKQENEGKTYYPTYNSFRVGLGGYAGVNVKEKQILKYENADGNDVKERRRGNYNINDFVYGLSAYVGYEAISLYVKYDLQPVFENNEIDQNNVSLGIRFDFN